MRIVLAVASIMALSVVGRSRSTNATLPVLPALLLLRFTVRLFSGNIQKLCGSLRVGMSRNDSDETMAQ